MIRKNSAVWKFWAKEHSGEHYGGERPEDNVLLVRRQISDIFIYVQYTYVFGCSITMAGYPTMGGYLDYPVEMQDAVGIVSKSPHKDGAWAFH